MFVDQARITVHAGKGGDGCSGFRREKFVPKGGPDGGNGGRGGHVYFEADKNLRTLLDFRYKRNYNAEDGHKGMGSNKTGSMGEDTIIRVPPGTIIREAETERIIADLTEDHQRELIAQGGRGGRGNACFASSTNRAPIRYEEGHPGESMDLVLELKLIADAGLVGKPNAGKSTLLSRLSAARPKVADYPFTTLEPMLGIVQMGEFESYALADIPGLIEGAHTGKGLGTRFLRHIERTKVLVFLVDLSDPDPAESLRELRHELESHNPELLKKSSMVVYNKLDLFETPPSIPEEGLVVSAATGQGLDELKRRIYDLITHATSD